MVWEEPENVKDLHQLVSAWPLMPPERAMMLLGASYPDAVCRSYAVKCIALLSDNELADYMLQVVQTLKYEPYHVSPLAIFLLLRALKSPDLIGQTLYWHLQAEEHNPEMAMRFKLLKKQLLKSLSAEKRDELTKQSGLMRELEGVAKRVQQVDKKQRLSTFQEAIKRVEVGSVMTLPLDASIQVRSLNKEKCKTLQSNTVPLWTVFHNSDELADDVFVIVKVGDDLRQDILILQIITVMDRVWKENNMDMYMLPYKCVATGDKAGMIEIVLNSKTTAGIHKETFGALGALNEGSIDSWLQKHNPTPQGILLAINTLCILS